MAGYNLAFLSKVQIAVADTTNFTDNGYCTFLQGGNTTQQLKVNEVSASGESAASNPTSLSFGRDSTVAATGISGNFNALRDGSATAPGTVALFGSVSTTKPQRSATLGHLIHTALNAFGGIYRWQARQGEEITTIGNGATTGELSLSSVTGTGQISGHILYELV
jgi:hypothetical protein